MNKLKQLWATEPARIIGTIGTIIVIVAEQLLDNGVVTANGSVNLLHTMIAAIPLILAELTRSQVTPA